MAVDPLVRHQPHQGIDQLLIGRRSSATTGRGRGSAQIATRPETDRRRRRASSQDRSPPRRRQARAAFTVLAISRPPPPDTRICRMRVQAAIERGGADDEDADAAAALDQIGGPGGDGLHDRQRNEAEHDQIDGDDRTPRTAGGAGAIHRQLTKLKAVTATQISPCHQRSLKVIVEQRAGEQPEHHDVAGRQRDQRRMPDRDRRREPMTELSACAAEPSAKAAASRPASTLLKSRNSDAAKHQQQRHGGAAQGEIEGRQATSDRDPVAAIQTRSEI